MSMKIKSSPEAWLSLEQASETLGLPWTTLLRWAKAGDPRLPAYRIWDDAAAKQGSYRYKKQDVTAFQTQGEEAAPTPLEASGSPAPE